jgi:hypothetical protein
MSETRSGTLRVFLFGPSCHSFVEKLALRSKNVRQ